MSTDKVQTDGSLIDSQTAKGVSIMSKKRYQEIADSLYMVFNDADKVEEALKHIRLIMNFDPKVKRYTPEMGLKAKEHRSKLIEQGISTYVALGNKRRYEQKKMIATS